MSDCDLKIGRGSRSCTCFLVLPRHPSPLLRPHRGILRRKPEKRFEGLRRTPARVETCAGLSQTCVARLPGSFHNTRDNEPCVLYFYMAAVLGYRSGVGPIRQLLLDVPPTVDPAGPQRGDHPTVQLSINRRRSCGSRSDPDSSRSRSGVKPLSLLSWMRLCVHGEQYGTRTRNK